MATKNAAATKTTTKPVAKKAAPAKAAPKKAVAKKVEPVTLPPAAPIIQKAISKADAKATMERIVAASKGTKAAKAPNKEGGKSKVEIARDIIAKHYGKLSRKDILGLFASEAGLSAAGSATYYANLTKDLKTK